MSETTKHTPGPWVVETETRGVGAIYNVKYRNGLDNSGNPLASIVATVYPDALCDEHTSDPLWGANANARLIAAAPDLLAALQGLLPMWDSGIAEPWVTAARAAIAKARGE